jgi:hypothetical protein
VHALAATQYSDAIPWLIVAGIALGAWLVLFLVVAAATMPKLPDAGPETMDLGPESPAVANFLVNRCAVTTSALSATLVDLAARDHLAIENIGGGEDLVRLRSGGDGTRNAYETEVLDLVRERARNDTVPAAELSLGYGDKADGWWKDFRRTVLDDARALGLVRRRFNRVQQVLLAATLAVPFSFAGVAFEVYGTAERAAGKKMDAGGGMVAAGLLWVGALAVGARVLRGWRPTASGKDATARWLGVRDFLNRDESFRETPPAGVAIWERLLAYGVALGVAHGTDAALPIGPTRDDEGWSPYRGLWRQVRIVYPKRFRYGESPARAAVMSVLLLAAFALVGIVVARTFVPAIADSLDTLVNGDNSSGGWIIAAVSLVLLGPVLFVATRLVQSIVTLQRALADVGKQETSEGYVVRVPWHFVSDNDGGGSWQPTGYTAVDDGHSDEVRALRFYDTSVREGQIVRVTVTPRMRHVLEMKPQPRADRVEAPKA